MSLLDDGDAGQLAESGRLPANERLVQAVPNLTHDRLMAGRVDHAARQHRARARRPADLDVVDSPGAVAVRDQLALVRPPVVRPAVRVNQDPEVFVRALEPGPPA